MLIGNPLGKPIIAYGGSGRRVPVPKRLAYPDFTLDRALKDLDHRILYSLSRLPQVSHQSLENMFFLKNDERFLKRKREELYDDLISFLPPRTGLPDYAQATARSLDESVASTAIVCALSSKNETPPTLELIFAIREALNLTAAFREGRVSTMPDMFKNVVDYPSVDSVPSLLHELDTFRQRYGALFPFCSAAVAFVAIVHAHPFSDGNGRTARTAFNVLTSIAIGRAVSLPLAVITLLTDGGFVLKLRRAMHGGEWAGFFRFLAAAGCAFADVELPSKAYR